MFVLFSGYLTAWKGNFTYLGVGGLGCSFLELFEFIFPHGECDSSCMGEDGMVFGTKACEMGAWTLATLCPHAKEIRSNMAFAKWGEFQSGFFFAQAKILNFPSRYLWYICLHLKTCFSH